MGKRQYRGAREASGTRKRKTAKFLPFLFLCSLSLCAAPLVRGLSVRQSVGVIALGSLFWCGAIGTIVFGWRLLRGIGRPTNAAAVIALLGALACAAGFAVFGPYLSKQMPAYCFLGGGLLSAGLYLFFNSSNHYE